MPLQPLTLRPGVTTEATQTLAEGTWAKSNLIRFRDGYLEKIFGWVHLNTTALAGRCRALTGWMDFDSIKYLAAGTNLRLYVYSAGALYDITPLRATTNPAVVVDTVISTATATITDVAHGCATGDQVNIVVPIAVGGLTLYGTYQVTVLDADNYTITAASNATATITNGGAVPLFTTTNASPTVKVTLAAHGLITGGLFTVDVSTTVATVVLSGQYIVTFIDADNFNITAGSNANAPTTGSENAGNARYQYLLASGLASSMASTGYGSGGYGLGTYGYGSGSGVAITPLRIWSLANFGQDLLALVNNGALYKWSPPASAGTRATAVGGSVPTAAADMFISMPEEQVVLLGAEVLGTQDPLLVRYSDIGDYTVWTATATNQAGSFRLSQGAKIVGGAQGSNVGYIWTDTDLWQMQYVNLPFVYTFNIIGRGCGLIAHSAWCQQDSRVYWMSVQGFFKIDGGVTPLPCAVWDTIFKDLDPDNADKIVAGSSSSQREVVWFYPSLSGGTGEIDSYVKLNTLTGEWDYGSLIRTAWLDQNVFGAALGVDNNGIIQQFNTTFNNDGAAMTGVLAETGFITISDGDQIMFLDYLVPDFKFNAAATGINLTVVCLEYPGGTPFEMGPYPVTAATEFVTVQARARQIALRITCDNIDTWFRLGKVRALVAPDGRSP